MSAELAGSLLQTHQVYEATNKMTIYTVKIFCEANGQYSAVGGRPWTADPHARRISHAMPGRANSICHLGDPVP